MSAVPDPAIRVVRHPRARRAKLALDPRTGEARLTLPPRMALAKALRWAESQRGWLAAEQARLPQPRPFAPGAVLPLDDGEVVIAWRETAPRAPRLEGAALIVGGDRVGLSRRVTVWLRRRALDTLSAETAEFAVKAGVSIGSVAVGDPRGRWGSCAASGAIRYSWRLILAPAAVRRATVAHEVAHRVHMNHGPAFHALVAKLLGGAPDRSRQWLKRHGAALHWLGRES